MASTSGLSASLLHACLFWPDDQPLLLKVGITERQEGLERLQDPKWFHSAALLCSSTPHPYVCSMTPVASMLAVVGSQHIHPRDRKLRGAPEVHCPQSSVQLHLLEVLSSQCLGLGVWTAWQRSQLLQPAWISSKGLWQPQVTRQRPFCGLRLAAEQLSEAQQTPRMPPRSALVPVLW